MQSENASVDAPAATPERVSFTFEWYERFLRAVDDAGYTFGRYDDPVDPGTVLLRHDVDLCPQRARRTAWIEHELGITGTYFFLVSSPMYNVLDETTRDVVRSIADLGHDVGLHFSTHQYWDRGSLPAEATIADRVAEERAVLASVVDPIETISFHIPPEGVLQRAFDAFPSTYEPQYFSEIGYRGDSGQRWREEPPTVADFDPKMQLLTHPGLWGDTDAPFEQRVREGTARMQSRTNDYAQQRYVLQQFG